MLARRWRRVKWWGLGGLASTAMIVLLVGAGMLWMMAEYTRAHPWNLNAYVPRIEKYLAARDIHIQIGGLEAFYDGAPVIRATDVRLLGEDGTLGVYVDQAAIKLANRRLLLLSLSPKIIEAKGVTLRVVRGEDSMRVAGLTLPKSMDGDQGLVEWLNGLNHDHTWGRMKGVKVSGVTLLVRDEVQRAEWVMEDGNLSISRYPEDGERGTMVAIMRRLGSVAASSTLVANAAPIKVSGTAVISISTVGPVSATAVSSTQPPEMAELRPAAQGEVPVMVSFRHTKAAPELRIRGRINQADVAMVADYLPPQFQDLLRAQGEVELGTRILEKNQIERPWLTVRLQNIAVQPPKGFSQPMKFKNLEMTVSYRPPLDGAADSDVLRLRELKATSERGNVWEISGTISQLTTDPLIDLYGTSAGGDAQGIFDFFPDLERGSGKALKWLRPNIMNAQYANLRAHYRGRPSAFPGCGDACGLVEIDADVVKGSVRFLKELTPAVGTSGTFAWRGQSFVVTMPQAKVGNTRVSDVRVQLDNIFSPSPTNVSVSATLVGDLAEVSRELNKMPEVENKVPEGLSGQHKSLLSVYVPMPRGVEPTFAMSTVLVSSSIANLKVAGLKELGGSTFGAKSATFAMDANKDLHLVADGMLDSYPLKIDWVQGVAPGKPNLMQLSAEGTLGGEWLMARAGNTASVSLTGPLGVAANIAEAANGAWRFGVKAEATRAEVRLKELNFSKRAGPRLVVETQGIYGPGGAVRLTGLKATGDGTSVAGSVAFDPRKPDETVVKLNLMKLGQTDAVVDYAARKARITGRRLDLRGIDLFGDDTSSTKVKNVGLAIELGEVLTRNGKLNNLNAQLNAVKGRWDVEKLTGLVDGNSKIDVRLVPLQGQPGRRKLSLDIENLGQTLQALGIYESLNGGHLTGELTYDAPGIGGGLFKMGTFELRNPPTLMKLLSLLSLEQIVAGTDATLFNSASLPVRVDGGAWFLDNASLEGPSMSIRLDGTYNSDLKELNFDGKMAPGIPLNRLVAKIPLLGTLLTGSQDGVVVADFKLKGPTKDPQVNVRPLSVLTPGLVKDLWKGLTGGTTPAAPKVIDGRTPK